MTDKIIRSAKTLYSSQPRLRGWAKKISSSKAYFYLTRLRIKSQIKKDLENPVNFVNFVNLVIELSNFCNARCLMCPNSTMKRRKSVMAKGIFEKIVSRIKEEKLAVNKVFLSGLGEPLIDPQIIQRIKAFKEMGLPVKLYTNAHLLTSEISQQLVDLKIEEINISFNGATPDHYQKVMGLDFDKAKENIESLLKIKKEKQSDLPKVLISSILIGENEKDIKKHLENWSGKVDSVTVSVAHEWGGGVKIDSNSGFGSSERTYPCRSLWQTMMIDSSGNFVICCRDYESGFVLGNVLTHSFAQIQKSPVLERFRLLNLEFSKQKLPLMCQKCNFPYQDGIEWYLPRSVD
ncbi:MAG: Fe-S oxidoreductase-like protein [Parcubacteria group bacterium GW2011_GWC2_39_11]|nr:MAG: Fe-S oxidoreductase-like protein [Parcubacteria group bacterium GW2011_GWC2_39_11]